LKQYEFIVARTDSLYGDFFRNNLFYVEKRNKTLRITRRVNMILILNNIYDRIKLAMEVGLFMFTVLREGGSGGEDKCPRRA
ncbi:MAG: hypothetical protein E6729_08945, partial [Finegoldia magna]|nr:hypothetical protein [Finegoldia magna]